MSQHSTNTAHQMRVRDKEMVPRILVIAMFSLMAASVALVAFAQLTDRPNVGVVAASPITEAMELTLTGDRTGHYVATDASGAVLTDSAQHKMGFVGVIGRVVDRNRKVHGVEGTPPLTVARHEDGHISITDPSTDDVIDLIGYGADNIAAFAMLLDQ